VRKFRAEFENYIRSGSKTQPLNLVTAH